ncbi:MAG TPA: TIGR03668 family PPOX class F420-dependent oxidoreductase [Acetobacteraceae bacterium]|nr:TIGR03668 family PPOX class F420-dependent oxidoreductase [Acetobacteraceae bacterium]
MSAETPRNATGGGSAVSALTAAERRFLEAARLAHLATADAAGRPHVMPVCFAVDGATIYITIDTKPKRPKAKLKRLTNIEQNPEVALVADRYDEDWSRLGWVMLRGRAEILADGDEHDRAQALLRERYPQYRAMRLEGLPVIAVRIARARSWGAVET